ncbi:hypothetical protein, partial [Arcticibacter sp.]|uniref:hypothetical protein n=1 Tax=Arcticibacter sp. TaxID=1872630 RepID=UPI00388FC320
RGAGKTELRGGTDAGAGLLECAGFPLHDGHTAVPAINDGTCRAPYPAFVVYFCHNAVSFCRTR